MTSVLPHDVPIVLRVALAAAAGAALPPVGACFRALLPIAWHRPGARSRRRVYAKDTAAVEVTWVAGPPVVLALGAAVSTGAALAAIGVLLAASTLAFAASKPSRAWRPEPRDDGRGGALRAPGLRTLIAVLLGVGFVFGATEVAVTAVGGDTAGPLLGLWGLGSLIAGLAASKLGGGARTAGGLVILLGVLGAAHAALALAGRPLALGVMLLLAGGDDRADLRHDLRHGRHRRPEGHRHRGVRLAGHRQRGRRLDRRRGRRHGRRPRRAGGRVRRRRPRRRHGGRHRHPPRPYAAGRSRSHPARSNDMTDVTGVDFVAIMTKDHDAAVKFYGETLGLPFVKQWGNMPGTEFQAGNLTLAVMQPDAFGFEWSPSATMIALQVDDVAATRAQAGGRRRGVPRRDPRQRRLPPVVLRRPGRQPARTSTTATRLRNNPLRAACRRSRCRGARSRPGSCRGRRPARPRARWARRRRRGSARPPPRPSGRARSDSRPLTHSTLPCSGSRPSSSARPIDLVHRVVAADVLAHEQQLAVGREQPGRVQAAGAGEPGLAQALGQVGEQRALDRRSRPGSGAACDGDLLQRALAAHAARRRRVEASARDGSRASGPATSTVLFAKSSVGPARARPR